MRMNMPRSKGSPPIASFQTAQAASAFRCVCFFGSGVLQPSALINMSLHDLPGLRYAPNNS